LVVWLGRHARPGRRPSDLALLAFAEGLLVPETTVRNAFAEAYASVRLSVERDAPTGSTVEDIAEAVVETGQRGTVVAARIQRIDALLSGAGVNWAPPELAVFDPGPASQPPAAADHTFMAVQALLAGAGNIDLTSLGSMARALLPRGAAAPTASNMEYGWPGLEQDFAGLRNEEGGLSFLPDGDMRTYLGDLAAAIPLDELKDAWHTATAMRTWAESLCDQVEHEVTRGAPGSGCEQWLSGVVGLSRVLLGIALRGQTAPMDTARNALLLIFMRSSIGVLRQLMPDGRFDLLSNPLIMPSFIAPFLLGDHAELADLDN
jgi:hypothetical protein